jgi:hypothetical protein
MYVHYSREGVSATASSIDVGNGAGLVATLRWDAVTRETHQVNYQGKSAMVKRTYPTDDGPSDTAASTPAFRAIL